MIDLFKKQNRNVIIASVCLALLGLLNIFSLSISANTLSKTNLTGEKLEQANSLMNNIEIIKWLIVVNIILFIIMIILATINKNKRDVKFALANFIIAIITTVISVVVLIVGGPFIGLITILLIVFTYQAYKQLKSPINSIANQGGM